MHQRAKGQANSARGQPGTQGPRAPRDPKAHGGYLYRHLERYLSRYSLPEPFCPAVRGGFHLALESSLILTITFTWSSPSSSPSSSPRPRPSDLDRDPRAAHALPFTLTPNLALALSRPRLVLALDLLSTCCSRRRKPILHRLPLASSTLESPARCPGSAYHRCTAAACAARAWPRPWWPRNFSTRTESTSSSGGTSAALAPILLAAGRRIIGLAHHADPGAQVFA